MKSEIAEARVRRWVDWDAHERLMLCALLDRADRGWRVQFMSVPLLAREAGVGRKRGALALHRLRDKGWVGWVEDRDIEGRPELRVYSLGKEQILAEIKRRTK